MVIRKRRLAMKSTEQQAETDDVDSKNCTRKSFLDLLISLSGGEAGYTDVELREEVLTLIIAGSDTSAIAMANTLLLMAKYPKVQDEVYNELSEVFAKPDRCLVKEDLKNLKYLEMVVKESLRLYPPLPFVTRKIETETVLPSGNILPAGCGVVVSLWGAQRDPKYWGPDAEHFNPERFLSDRMESLYPCSYMPFSNGPRNCLGYQYALMSIKTALASILRRYKVVGQEESGPVPQIPFKIEIMMKTVDGYQINLETRN